MAAKRALGIDEPGTGKKSKLEDEVKGAKDLRCLIDNNQVGAIIGKGGVHVKRCREEFGAVISINKTDNKNVNDRVMVVRGTNDAICDAVQVIAHNLLEAQAVRTKRKEESTDVSAIPFKLLVHKLSIGALLGKGGATIKDTQAQTHTIMQISKEPLPGSTEKSVTITGTPENIRAALGLILTQLASAPLKGSVENYPYTPGASPVVFATPQAYGLPVQASAAGFGVPAGFAPYAGYSPIAAAAAAGPTSSATTSQKIAIPTNCVGVVIGKGGSVIRDLRIQSGTNISIAPAEPTNAGERVVTVTGSAEGIQTAVYLIRQLIEQQPIGAVQDY